MLAIRILESLPLNGTGIEERTIIDSFPEEYVAEKLAFVSKEIFALTILITLMQLELADLVKSYFLVDAKFRYMITPLGLGLLKRRKQLESKEK